MRDMRLAALDANTNFDSQDNQQAKRSRIEGLQDSFREGERMLYSDKAPEPQGDAFGDDPLFDPLRRRAQTLQVEANRPLVKQAGMGRQLLEAMES
jgi:hypothetical protein